jgi:hypothetical protein
MQLLVSLDDAARYIDDLGTAFQSDNAVRALAAQTRVHRAWRDALIAVHVLEKTSGVPEVKRAKRTSHVVPAGACAARAGAEPHLHLAKRAPLRAESNHMQRTLRRMSRGYSRWTAAPRRLACELPPAIDTLDGVLRGARASLMKLTSAIGQGDYFGSWLAAVQLRAALYRARCFVHRMPTDDRASARGRLDGLVSLAYPMLVLAPVPTRVEVKALRTPDAQTDPRAWKRLERQWRWKCCVLPTRFSHSR